MAVVIAIDAGTTGVRCLAVDRNGRAVRTAYREFRQHFPVPGWVEHDALEIWEAVAATIAEVAVEPGRTGGGRRPHQPAGNRRRLAPPDRAATSPGHRLAGPPDGDPL